MARKPPAEHEAFLSAIVETPDNDAPRLVYADWLDEHGQTASDRARAEFIREQIRLLRAGELCQVYDEGSERLAELRRQYGKTWQSGLPEWAVRHARFERGFISSVTGTARQFLQDGARLRELIPLQWLRLERPEGTLKAVIASGLLAGLRTFCLTGALLGAEELSALARCPDLDGLTELMLGRCRIGRAGARILADAPWLAGVEQLDLIANDVGPDGARALASVPFRKLNDLNLQANYVGDNGLAAMLASRSLPTHLTALNLCFNELGPDGARALAGCVRLRGLRILQLTNNDDLGDAGARALAASPHLAGLQRLDLRATRVSDAGAAALAASPHLSNLTKLCLSDNPIMGEGIYELLNSPHLKRLDSLSVYSPRRKQDAAALQAVRDRFDRP